MNTFKLHEAAQQLAESETAYNIARMYLNLKHEIKWPEHEFNIIDAVKQFGNYEPSGWIRFINYNKDSKTVYFYLSATRSKQTVFTIEGYNECVKELAEAAWLNNGEPQYYHIHKRVIFDRLYDEALREDIARTAYFKYRRLQALNGLFVSPSWDKVGKIVQQVWFDMIDFPVNK